MGSLMGRRLPIRDRSPSRTLARVSAILLIFGSVALLQLGYRALRTGVAAAVTSDSDLWFIGGSGLVLGVAVYLVGDGRRSLSFPAIDILPRLLVLFAYGLLSILFPLAVFSGILSGIPLLFLRMMTFGWICVAAALALRSLKPTLSLERALVTTVLSFAVIYRIAIFLAGISDYPFSLGWSEASRYYYASLFFSKSIYGVDAPPSVLHPTRYLLQSIPFLFPQLELIVHRMWQVVLWLGMPLITLGLLIRRLGLRNRWTTATALLWGFLFLFQGPVLYHLFGSVIPVLLGFDSKRFWRSLLVVVLGSVWAGVSRINWFPVPGMLAAALFFLEAPAKPGGAIRAFAKPALFLMVGVSSAFAAQAAYAIWSGIDLGQFASSFSSSLLWYRLFPNPTFRVGMLGGIGLAALPLVAILVRYVRTRVPHVSLLAIGGMLLLLLGGGTIVSVKIGGGSNLHNYDAFLLILLVAGAYAFFQKTSTGDHTFNLGWWHVASLLVVPVGFALSLGGAIPQRNRDQSERVLQEIQTAIDSSQEGGGEVLFIAERHLLTFDLVQGIRLVPEFEKVFLMEMAMSGNQPYLSALKQGLEDRRFSVIVSDPLRVQLQGRRRAFGEENDAWVQQVSVPILCHYSPVFESAAPPVQILLPKQDQSACDG
jgi:hypothetical protein